MYKHDSIFTIPIVNTDVSVITEIHSNVKRL